MRLLLSLLFLLLWAPAPVRSQPSEKDILNQIDPETQKEVEHELKEDLEGPLEEGDLAREPFRILIKADFGLNYVFAESPETFVVNYKLEMEGTAKNKVDLIKGNARVTTGVQGFLAKWPTGGCELRVSVGEVPYEIIFSKIAEEKIELDTKIGEEITERWESNCKFEDAPRAKFNTIGNPELWLAEAVRKSANLLRGVKIPIDRLHKKTSQVKFNFDPFLIADPPLGSAEIEGKGTIEIIPQS